MQLPINIINVKRVGEINNASTSLSMTTVTLSEAEGSTTLGMTVLLVTLSLSASSR